MAVTSARARPTTHCTDLLCTLSLANPLIADLLDVSTARRGSCLHRRLRSDLGYTQAKYYLQLIFLRLPYIFVDHLGFPVFP
jgi:hypothetical protein